MRRFRPVLWLMVLGAAAHAQVYEETDFSGYSGFVREVREYTYEGSLDLPAGNGAFIQVQGLNTQRREISFSFADGVATGTLSDRNVDTYSGHIHFVGRCFNGRQGTADQVETGETVGTANASGAAVCFAAIDEFGYGAECWSDVPWTFTTSASSSASLSATCAEIEPYSSTQNTTESTEDFGFGASFSGSLKAPLPAVVSGSTSVQLDPWTVRTTSWVLVRQGEHELLLEPQGDYDGWRPKGGASERERGNTLVIKATLRKRGGGKPNVLAKEITFRLAQRSHEPGVMMNDPSPSQRALPALPDLAFQPDLNEPLALQVDKELATARTVEGSYEVAYVQVSSFDWGAYGVITAEALLHSGERVAGVVESGGYELLIPKRQSIDDPIAAGWRNAGAGRGGDALSDDDALPEGDGHTGDGLSLYEEYRGFKVSGLRVETDPERKELFLLNFAGPKALRGAAQFAQATGLKVELVAANELDERNAINFNTSGRFQRVRQHGLRIDTIADERNYAIAVGGDGPATPGRMERVEVPIDFLATTPAYYVAATVAHELAHGVNVRHHGETDLQERRFFVFDGAVYETSADDKTVSTPEGMTPVTLLNEDGSPFPLADVDPDSPVEAGVRQGQHSGDQACLMRYDTANFHVRGDPSQRFRNASEEVVGVGLCSSATGTGVNASTRAPAPRYGDAATRRGDCLHQLCVNDRHVHAAN